MITENDIIGALSEDPASLAEIADLAGASLCDIRVPVSELRKHGEILFKDGKYVAASAPKTEEPAPRDEEAIREAPGADPGDTASSEPEEDIDAKKAQVIEVLKAAPTRLAFYKIIDKIGYTGGRERAGRKFRKHLDQWVKGGLLKRDGSFHYWVPGYERNHPTIGNIASGKVPSFGKKMVPAETVNPPRNDGNKNDALAAIDRMTEKMQRRAIDNIAIKTAVLRKLSPIVDPSIAQVLEEIAWDLEGRG